MLGPFSTLSARDATLLNAPDAPTNLQVAQASTNQAQLRWEHFGGSDTFEIDRSADGGAFSQIDTASAGDRKYTDTGPLTDGVQYTYRVRATNTANGDSENSDTTSVTIDTAETFPDDSPEDLVASITDGVDGQGKVTLTWSDTSSNEDGFRVFRDGLLVDFPSADATTTQITGNDDETEYEWEVMAQTGGGANPSIKSEKRTLATRLAAPSNVTKTLTEKFHHFEWTNNTGVSNSNVEILKSGVLYDTLPKGTTEYDVAIAVEETFMGSVRAIASGFPDSIAVAATL